MRIVLVGRGWLTWRELGHVVVVVVAELIVVVVLEG